MRVWPWVARSRCRSLRLRFGVQNTARSLKSIAILDTAPTSFHLPRQAGGVFTCQEWYREEQQEGVTTEGCDYKPCKRQDSPSIHHWTNPEVLNQCPSDWRCKIERYSMEKVKLIFSFIVPIYQITKSLFLVNYLLNW